MIVIYDTIQALIFCYQDTVAFTGRSGSMANANKTRTGCFPSAEQSIL